MQSPLIALILSYSIFHTPYRRVYAIFMDHIRGGTLKRKIVEDGNPGLGTPTIKDYSYQILSGLSYLHQNTNRNVIHWLVTFILPLYFDVIVKIQV